MRRALLVILAMLLSSSAALAGGVHYIQVHGIINTGTTRYIERGIEQAEAAGAKLLVVRLDTPGGLLSSTRVIVQKINQSKVPVAVWVAPSGASATSAGTIITMAAHFAAMAPGTNIGAAHPVGGQGEDIKGAMGEKAVNDTVAFIKAQAAERGRNVEWAEQAIRKSASATADEAARRNIVDFLAAEFNDVVMGADKKQSTLHATGEPVTELKMTLAERFLTFIGDPNVSYLLMALGGLGIYAELSAPGIGLPGIFGAICLILGFISLSTLPVNYGAVALIILSMFLFVAEIYVTSYGVLTIGGVVALLVGALLLMDPSTGDLRLSLALVIPTVLAIGLITAAIGFVLVRSRRAAISDPTGFAGFIGVVESVDATGFNGKCHVRGEVWDFELTGTSKRAQVADRLEVIERKGMKLLVKPRVS